MKNLKIGIVREGKIPPDKRVPFTPDQVLALEKRFSQLSFTIQPSHVRAFKDKRYSELGLTVDENIEDCDILMGVKEVNVADLIPNKKYIFFSHTVKMQSHNQKLLKAILAKKIQLIDYELLTDTDGKRVIGFGRFAGIVGCYNGFLTYGLKQGIYDLKPANQCDDYVELKSQLDNIRLSARTKIVITGNGRVGKGALEIMNLLKIQKVSPHDFLTKSFTNPVYTQLSASEYYQRTDGKTFNKSDFYQNKHAHTSTFINYLREADLFMACHYWDPKAPEIISNEDLRDKERRVSVIADISCDVNGPIASTIRASSIANPIYGYDPQTGLETNFDDINAIAVMAVDNLPCELPKDASAHFGAVLSDKVIPALLGDDPSNMIERASETNLNGELNSAFSYLKAYVDRTEKRKN